ncbi:hypothetical protein ONS95_004344 [Cadophora gregata]|uniref:uncharacterized protein n=1 Tax=Cadophora gregata TaxID=51156 RepID=UPI0026DBE1E9|nr:uncharacterized protein ONS95_004344 [Cadophora gregata]KAK0105270.1 hypothetical protein ONS96_004667 [Cadophora gregata f. sp. sojae]KAK0105829.1 hypothetical protein ONS95_004344 [Cadophora gregata]
MFQPNPYHYCKDDQDHPNLRHDPVFKSAEEQNVFVQFLLQAIYEARKFEPSHGISKPNITKLPICNSEPLVGYSRSLVTEKYRERASFAPIRTIPIFENPGQLLNTHPSLLLPKPTLQRHDFSAIGRPPDANQCIQDFRSSNAPPMPDQPAIPVTGPSIGEVCYQYPTTLRAETSLGLSFQVPSSAHSLAAQEPQELLRLNAVKKKVSMHFKQKINDRLGPDNPSPMNLSGCLRDPREMTLLCALRGGFLLWDLATGKLLVRDGCDRGCCGELLCRQASDANDALEKSPDGGFGLIVRGLRQTFLDWQQNQAA